MTRRYWARSASVTPTGCITGNSSWRSAVLKSAQLSPRPGHRAIVLLAGVLAAGFEPSDGFGGTSRDGTEELVFVVDLEAIADRCDGNGEAGVADADADPLAGH